MRTSPDGERRVRSGLRAPFFYSFQRLGIAVVPTHANAVSQVEQYWQLLEAPPEPDREPAVTPLDALDLFFLKHDIANLNHR
jgi:hypothetical protein